MNFNSLHASEGPPFLDHGLLTTRRGIPPRLVSVPRMRQNEVDLTEADRGPLIGRVRGPGLKPGGVWEFEEDINNLPRRMDHQINVRFWVGSSVDMRPGEKWGIIQYVNNIIYHGDFSEMLAQMRPTLASA